MKRKILNNSGITLLELVVSIAILSIILITFAGLFMNAFKYNAMSGDKLQSVNLAQEYASKIKEEEWKEDFKLFISEINISTEEPLPDYKRTKDFYLEKMEEKRENNLYSNLVAFNYDGEFYSMELHENKTIIFIRIKAKPEFFTDKRLYSVNIEVKKTETDKMPSKTYLYYEYE
ncbi:prepilin-type N-terminal cleavage/methylation domain-containing protein [Metabacillus fastidiosus]|uniref:prepilin-type N-terminal cleavage/methylation domain-containing protein n=1 Tax=Metabacillus fastidiosus TaxID=1458 RepID=UPI003D2C64E9